jgi:NADH dehydrogenase
MRDLSDALRLRSVLINRLEEASLVEDREVRRRLLTFVVAGGGYTGVETAGQLADFVLESRRYYSQLREAQMKIVLVHSGAEILPEIGPAMGAYARKVLGRRGVEVRLNSRVVAATARRIHLKDGEVIEANTIVTTVGNAPNPIVTDLCRQLGLEPLKGRIPVEATMQVKGQKRLWAAGDCAAVPWMDRGQEKISPPTAQFAVRQGRQLAQNLIRAGRGQPPRPFHYRYLGQLATIGSRQAVAEVLGIHFKGLFAWWLWRTIYLAKLPGALRRLRVTVDWTFDLFFPRDISLIMPEGRERPLKPESLPDQDEADGEGK